MADLERRALERLARFEQEWRARVALAVLRVHLGELELLGETRYHLVVREREKFFFIPLSPPQTVTQLEWTCTRLGLFPPLSVRFGPSRFTTLEGSSLLRRLNAPAFAPRTPRPRIAPPSPWGYRPGFRD